MSYDWRKDLDKPFSIRGNYVEDHSSFVADSETTNPASCTVTKKDIEELKAAVLLTALTIKEQGSRCLWSTGIEDSPFFWLWMFLLSLCCVAIGIFIFFVL